MHHIVVIENEHVLRRQLLTTLEMAGFIVDGAGTLREALDLLDSKTYSLAIVDLMLNDPLDRSCVGGFEILDIIREHRKNTKTIVLSGQPSPRVKADAVVHYKADWYMDKLELVEHGSKHLLNIISDLLSK